MTRGRLSLGLPNGTVAALVLAVALRGDGPPTAYAAGGVPSAGPEQDFSDEAAFRIKVLNGAVKLNRHFEEKPGPTGKPALTLSFDSPRENAGALLRWRCAPAVLDGQVFQVYLETHGERLPYLTVRFLAPNGKQVCRHTYFGATSANWQPFTFAVGEKGAANFFDPKGGFSAGQKVGEISLELGGDAGGSARVSVSDFCLVGSSGTQQLRTAGKPEREPFISSGDTALWLEEKGGHSFSGALVSGQWLHPDVTASYPVFTFVDSGGKRVTLPCRDGRWQTEARKLDAGRAAVRYSCSGTTLELTYTAKSESLECRVSVIEEADLRLECVGGGTVFGTELGPDDYGIVPSGLLVRPAPDKPYAFNRRGNSDNTVPNFTAARIGDRVFFCNPLTYSHSMHLKVQRAGETDLVYMGTTLYFRPNDFRDPKTKLVHRELAWRIELAGDVNGDAQVDWVDCGLAYRDRYIKPNRDLSASLRDSYIFYHPTKNDSYEKIVRTIERMDFATGHWWVKGAMVTSDREASERHPYKVERGPVGDKAPYAARIRATGSRVGIYYGHDYIDAKDGNWPPELIKTDPDGNWHKYYVSRGKQLYYKDNIRGLATGKLKEHYETIIDVVRLEKGDSVQLDTFAAYARPGYHPDYPATPQNETEAKHEIARWLKYEHGITVGAEAITEGTQDVVDFGSVTYKGLDRWKFWKSKLPRQSVPLTTVIYHGSTYCGVSWYELRKKTPNWAALMAVCGKHWDWSSVAYPKYIYEKAARTFFNCHAFWARIADHKIVDIDQEGTAYTITFENGAVLWTDPEEKRFWLQENGIRYDGFSPFSSKGVMAILKQGDFDITLPIKDDLEILPSQPHREKLDVTISKTDEGFVRVAGNFSKVPWKQPFLFNKNKREVTEEIDVEPVLMLRRRNESDGVR
ncbi:MAG: hypothetical protein JXR37_28495 [Kiritimatiellae bacterium]|nr:hypothetical protein [Kiritimatiellia bacterium]